MQWIKTGRRIGQTVKNVQRLRHILAVFARHGFADVVLRMNLGRYLPSRLNQVLDWKEEKSPAERLRQAFEELGPTFVKLGQLLSTRPDVIPEAFVEELTRLQDNVQPLPFSVIKTVIESELGKPLAQCFAHVEELPLASASIAQVHEARLNSGEKVVIKVQRPGIDKIIHTDISMLSFLAGLLEKYVPETRVANPSIFVKEFFNTLQFELDFVVEASNIRKFALNMAEFPDVVVPIVYKDHSSRKVLTLEKLEGIRVNDLKNLTASGVDRAHIVKVGATSFFKSILVHGLFHGDLHGGNVFILPGNKIGIIDFGIVGRLSQRARDHLAEMVLSLLSEDYENLCYQYAELGASDPSINFDEFQREVQNTLSPYMGMNLSEVNSGRVLIEATKIAAKHHIRVPGEWMLVFKAILTMEGMGRMLDPTFDFLSLGHELVKDLVKSQYSWNRVKKDFVWMAKDLSALIQSTPRQIRWMFKKLNRNDFAFEIKSPDLQDLRKEIETSSRRNSQSLIAASLIIAASLALQRDFGSDIAGYPALSVIFLCLGVVFIVRLWFLK